MDNDKTSTSGSQTRKAEPVAAPSDAELSRIAREAVHQAPDPRLDRQLARMGLADAPEATASQPSPAASISAASDAALERDNARLRRTVMVLGVLLVAVAILALTEAVLLLR